MVVVTESWAKDAGPFASSDVGHMGVSIGDEPNAMTAKAVLNCHANSHPFQDRTLLLEPAKPVKVGRSVARAKATPTNAIFDCKVLSRHHALLWFDKGKFFLQDTKSSNGTFVNNNKLVPDVEHYEVRSGDIIQFGVDVVENNRKVTHGCIIATLRLYLPDGREIKPVRNEVAPLDELYKLNQIIQEATQREQCLETKLVALQQLVDETRLSVDDTWQAYVGEERLLSRVAALENQLTQAAKKGAGDDANREELRKLRDENAAFQNAAKEALDKLHAERLDALAAASEQQRARISAQQEALLAREQLGQAQLEVELLARKYMEEQVRVDELQKLLKQRDHELLLTKTDVTELEAKMKMIHFVNSPYFKEREEKIIAEEDERKDVSESKKAQTELNGVEPQQNHINLTVSPVDNIENNNNGGSESETTENDQIDEDCEWSDKVSSSGPGQLVSQNTISNENEPGEENKHVTFKLPTEEQDRENDNVEHKSALDESAPELEDNEKQDDEDESDAVDSKTLKYQFQSAQNELKKKIEVLEIIIGANKTRMADLERELGVEKATGRDRAEENTHLKEELLALEQRLKESHNEGVQLRNRVASLTNELGQMMQQVVQQEEGSTPKEKKNKETEDEKREKEETDEKEQQQTASEPQAISDSVISYEQLVGLEEELVLLKERFAQLTEDRLRLRQDLAGARDQYNRACNRSHNMLFFYVAPLVLIIVYLMVSALVS